MDRLLHRFMDVSALVYQREGMIRMKATPSESLHSHAGTICGVRVLLVEGVKHARDVLVVELSERGFIVQGTADATGLLSRLDSAVEADVIVLEWELSQTSGIDLLLQLRERGVNLPVVFLTTQTQQVNEKLAFGADTQPLQSLCPIRPSGQPILACHRRHDFGSPPNREPMATRKASLPIPSLRFHRLVCSTPKSRQRRRGPLRGSGRGYRKGIWFRDKNSVD